LKRVIVVGATVVLLGFVAALHAQTPGAAETSLPAKVDSIARQVLQSTGVPSERILQRPGRAGLLL
jgi:hypothetical protein